MRLIKVANKEELGRCAAKIFMDAIAFKRDIALGLTAGLPMIPLYRELARAHMQGRLDFSRARAILLDERVGLAGDDPQSRQYFLNGHLLRHVNIERGNAHFPDGAAADLDAECARYTALAGALGGIDLQLLGIGGSGQLGCNEPSDSFSNRAHVVWSPENDGFSITLDVRRIMLARKIVLVADAERREIAERALNGPITPRVPASALQLHRDATVILVAE